MNFELSVFYKKRIKFVQQILIQLAIATFIGLCCYYIKVKFNNPTVDVIIFFVGILAMYILSVIPHYVREIIKVNKVLQHANREWVIKDENNNTISSYVSYEKLKRKNKVQFSPNVVEYKYKIMNIKTGEIKGTVTQQVNSSWEKYTPKTEKIN